MCSTRAYSDTAQQGRDYTLEGRIEESLMKGPTHEVRAVVWKPTRDGEALRAGNSGKPVPLLGLKGKEKSRYCTWVRGAAIGMNYQSELWPQEEEHSHCESTVQKTGSRETKFLHLSPLPTSDLLPVPPIGQI